MRIALLGDVALLGRYDRTKTSNVEERLEAIRAITKSCDFVIANLETPLTTLTKTMACKGAYLRSDPCNAKTLNYLGVTHVSLANNHIFDYGSKGKKETVETLEHCNISYVGLNNPPALLTKGEDRVLLDGFCCYSSNGMRYGTKPGQLKVLSCKTVNEFLEQAKLQEALPIISAHFGIEGVHYPSVEHRNFFSDLCRINDFILHGNHPHAIQGVEKFGSSLMVYAQGNLCFDCIDVFSIRHMVGRNDTPEVRENMVAVIDIKKQALVDYELYGFSDFDDGFQHRSKATEENIDTYSQAFKLPLSEYAKRRSDAVKALPGETRKNTIRFVMDRLNRKYIGAYIKGIYHEKKYRNIFRDYIRH